MLGSVWQWTSWIAIAAGLDLAVWSALRRVSVLADNPGGASALALCWVHAFVLPSLFPRSGLVRPVLSAALGVLAAPFALAVGFLAGLQVGSMALLAGLALGGPHDGSAVHDPPGPFLGAVEDVLGDVLLWSGPAAGAAVAAMTALGLAALLPGPRRVRLSWWLVAAGGWASLVFLPDWLIRALHQPWRDPVLLVAGGLPSALLVNRHTVVPGRADASREGG